MTSEYKNGTCTWCGNTGVVYKDNGRCEECDGDVCYCTICKEDQHCQSACRHVFRDDEFQWTGAGINKTPEDNTKISFQALLTAMPTGFAHALRKAILSGDFYTWAISPIIGSGGSLTLHGMDYPDSVKYGDDLLNLAQKWHADIDLFSDGYYWLTSLYQDNTVQANKLTIQWIDEWDNECIADYEFALDRLADDGCPLVTR